MKEVGGYVLVIFKLSLVAGLGIQCFAVKI